jgi:hypothetical protein
MAGIVPALARRAGLFDNRRSSRASSCSSSSPVSAGRRQCAALAGASTRRGPLGLFDLATARSSDRITPKWSRRGRRSCAIMSLRRAAHLDRWTDERKSRKSDHSDNEENAFGLLRRFGWFASRRGFVSGEPTCSEGGALSGIASSGVVHSGHEPSAIPRCSIGDRGSPITAVFPSHVVALSCGGACAVRIRSGRAWSTPRAVQRWRHHSLGRVGHSGRWARLERRSEVIRPGRGGCRVTIAPLGGSLEGHGFLEHGCCRSLFRAAVQPANGAVAPDGPVLSCQRGARLICTVGRTKPCRIARGSYERHHCGQFRTHAADARASH